MEQLALPIKIGIFHRTRPVLEIKTLKASDINDLCAKFSRNITKHNESRYCACPLGP